MISNRLISGVLYTPNVLRGMITDGVLPLPIFDGPNGPQWEPGVEGTILSGLISNDEAALRDITQLVKDRRRMGDSMAILADNAPAWERPDYHRLIADNQVARDRAEAYADAAADAAGGNKGLTYDSLLAHNLSKAGRRP